MRYNPDFDVDFVLRILGTVSEKYGEGSPEDEALRVAAVALLYVRDNKQLEDYRRYFNKFFTPAIDAITISHTFKTREEADQWLAGGTATDGELVRIADQGFRVITGPKGLKFLRTPLPEELAPPGPK
jgi:hypothetical protein